MMSISTMRRLDRWLGAPLCALLTIPRRLQEWFGRPADAAPQRIVFVKLAEQGSTVLAFSAITRAIEMVGRDNVFFVVFEDNRFILDAMKLIGPENVLTLRHHRVSATMMDAIRAIRRMRKLQVDAAIDLEFFARSSAALSYLSGAVCRVGLHAFDGEGPYRGDLLTHRLRFNPHLHTSQTFRLMVEALGKNPHRLPTFDASPLPADEMPRIFEPGPGAVEEARSLLRRAACTEHPEPLILLNANCSDLLPLRKWPADRYVELARRLIACYPELWVAMTGGPAEAAATAALVEQVRSARCFNLGGQTSLQQLLVVYSLAEILVTNDSGPAHFAALTAIDVVTLFGPEHPKLFAARSPRNHVFWEGIACSPCLSALNNRTSHCRENLCMQRIDVDRVFDQVCALYETRKHGAPRSGGA